MDQGKAFSASRRIHSIVLHTFVTKSWCTDACPRRKLTKWILRQRQEKAQSRSLQVYKANRRRKGGDGPGKSAVCDFLAGKTHKRGAVETRGRKSKLPRGSVQVAFAQRRKLIRNANNHWLAPWRDSQAARKQLRDKFKITERQLKDNYKTTIRQL